MKRTIRIGSRESRLAVRQAELIIDRIHRNDPKLAIELVTMKTTGDKILDRTLDQIGGKGLFVKELDKALLEGTIDLAVHSLKDMPMQVHPELPILAYSEREDPRDALVLPFPASDVFDLSNLGCSSARRRVQLCRLFEHTRVSSVRGNVLTRLQKLDRGEYSALVLACAGLKRLGLANRISRIFSPEEILPAAGQGILAVQGRKGADCAFLDAVRDADSCAAACAERAFVRALNGGCTEPIAAYAQIKGREMKLTGFYCDEKEGRAVRSVISGNRDDGERLGETLAQKIRQGG